MGQEEEIQAMIEKMNKLKNFPQPVNPNLNQFDNQDSGEFVQTQGGGEFDNQGPVKPVVVPPNPQNPNPPVNPQPGQPNIINTTGVQMGVAAPPAKLENVCPQCGVAHPPLPEGEKCPNASVVNEVKDFKIDEAQLNTYIVNIRNIIISKMSEKNIKDGTKFFQYAIVELTKSMEKYNE